MKLFTTSQIAALDRYTIAHEPIADIDLMERAALEMASYLDTIFPRKQPLVFFAGTGNNGGDALSMARRYAGEEYPCSVYLLTTGRPLSPSCAANLELLKAQGMAAIRFIAAEADFPPLNPEVPIIEGLFGAGLTRPLEGLAAALVRHINRSGTPVYAIDMPAGLMGEDNSGNNPENIIKATETLTLQFPKLSLLFPENEEFAGNVEVMDIGLHPEAIATTETPFRMTARCDIRKLFLRRKKFSHKGTFGHALLVAGSYGKMGAAVMASRACLRSGAGLLTTHVPGCGVGILQTATPETMCSIDPHEKIFSRVPELAKYSAISAGPGLGTHPDTGKALFDLLETATVPLVLDADALNLIAATPRGLQKIPRGSILTPHPGEYRRLFGDGGTAATDPITPATTATPAKQATPANPPALATPATTATPAKPATSDSWQRLEQQRRLSQSLGVVIVLKGAHTTITLPDGQAIFNPTGNPGMATAGSGDVLTGIILSLLAQGFPSANAAIAGVYLHGLAGDLAARKTTEPALIASDIIRCLPAAFREIYDRPLQEID